MAEPNLEGFSPVFFINLDRSAERRAHIECACRTYGIEARRIRGIDARDDDPDAHLAGDRPDNIDDAELACTLSHLTAIRQYLEAGRDAFGIVIEDDLDFDTCSRWPFSFRRLLDAAPYDWDVLQLSIINDQEFIVNIHKRLPADASAACYVISRHYAEKLMRLHRRGDRFRIDQGVRPRAVADELIYNAGKTYSIPLFTCRPELGSTIHTPDHVARVHEGSCQAIRDFWANSVRRFPVERILSH